MWPIVWSDTVTPQSAPVKQAVHLYGSSSWSSLFQIFQMGENAFNIPPTCKRFWKVVPNLHLPQKHIATLLFDGVVNVQFTACPLECFGLLNCVFDEFWEEEDESCSSYPPPLHLSEQQPLTMRLWWRQWWRQQVELAKCGTIRLSTCCRAKRSGEWEEKKNEPHWNLLIGRHPYMPQRPGNR